MKRKYAFRGIVIRCGMSYDFKHKWFLIGQVDTGGEPL